MYCEWETKPRIRHQTKGTISFVNNGNNSHGSQVILSVPFLYYNSAFVLDVYFKVTLGRGLCD